MTPALPIGSYATDANNTLHPIYCRAPRRRLLCAGIQKDRQEDGKAARRRDRKTKEGRKGGKTKRQKYREKGRKRKIG